MFGYVQINREKLTPQEYDRFRAYYCGLCHTLKKRYGNMGRMTLSYDMTFLSLVLTSLYEPEECNGCRRCICHPFKTHPETESEVTAYAADMNVALSYHKCLDDWHDEKKVSAWLMTKALGRAYRKVNARYPEKCQKIAKTITELSQYEKASSTDIDKMTKLVGELMGEIYAYQKDMWSQELRQMGDGLGRFIYLMDAYEDLPRDKKLRLFNPLLPFSQQDGYEAFAEQLLTMEMESCSQAFEMLPLVKDAHLMRNVLYSGVWGRYAMVQQKKQKSKGKTK